MKKVISMVLTLALLFALSVPAFASGEQVLTQAEKEALYTKYEELVAAANEEYGYEISVLPFDEIETFHSVGEYAQVLKEYCELKKAPQVRVPGESTGILRGTGVTTVPALTTMRHGSIIVTIRIDGTFDVRRHTNGVYYVHSQSFAAQAVSNNSALYYTNRGTPRITGYADGGRTMIVSADFDVYMDNYWDDTVSVSVYYYFNDNTGTITVL